MSKDRRLYAKFTLDFPDNPKVLPLSDGAFRCLVEATIWSREHETDGRLARRLALARWSLDQLQELCNNDDDNPSLIETETGWIIRDFCDHQDTKAEIDTRREQAIIAGRKGGIARAKRTAKRTAKRMPSEPVSKTQAEKRREENINPTYVSPNGDTPVGGRISAHTNGTNHTTTDPPPPCPRHGENYNHSHPCRDCQHRREYDETRQASETAAEAEQRRQRRTDIDACEYCDPTGLRETPTGMTQCTHNPDTFPAEESF